MWSGTYQWNLVGTAVDYRIRLAFPQSVAYADRWDVIPPMGFVLMRGHHLLPPLPAEESAWTGRLEGWAAHFFASLRDTLRTAARSLPNPETERELARHCYVLGLYDSAYRGWPPSSLAALRRAGPGGCRRHPETLPERNGRGSRCRTCSARHRPTSSSYRPAPCGPPSGSNDQDRRRPAGAHQWPVRRRVLSGSRRGLSAASPLRAVPRRRDSERQQRAGVDGPSLDQDCQGAEVPAPWRESKGRLNMASIKRRGAS